MIAGTEGGGSYDGSFIAGGDRSIELDISTFANPTTKNATDLVTWYNTEPFPLPDNV